MELKFRCFYGKGVLYSELHFDTLHSFFGYYYEQFYFDDNGVEDVKIMQFTGLKDKNGKDIYEGDILSFDGNITADDSMGHEPNGFCYDEDSKHEVIWNKELAGWEPKFDEDEMSKYKRHTRSLMITGDCEVIGCVYELMLYNNYKRP